MCSQLIPGQTERCVQVVDLIGLVVKATTCPEPRSKRGALRVGFKLLKARARAHDEYTAHPLARIHKLLTFASVA
jgi:hypothetical protein